MKPVRALALILLSLALASCATPRGGPGALPDLQPGERPPHESDEAGLWMHMDRIEKQLKTSGRLVTDPGLNDYVRGVVCRLATEYCGDLRVYLVANPHFNASIAPNGWMQVWTGLLLRAQNEAQLAYVLGHEISHYVRRHSVQQWRDLRTKADALIFLQLAAAAAGQGYAGSLAQLIALGSVFKFSRDQEREADSIGFELLAEAGYDAREAAKVWEALLEEQEAADDPAQFIFFSTHPPSEERMETMQRLAAEYTPDGAPGIKGQKRYFANTLPFRSTWLRDELRQRDFGRAQVVLDHLFETGVNLGELHYFQGELYRLRGEEGDEAEAIAAYEEALGAGGAPPDIHRSMGLVWWNMGERAQARAAFEEYLRSEPGARDREMIEAYLRELG